MKGKRMLTGIQKTLLLNFIEGQDVDVRELDSYESHINPQNYNRFAEPDDDDWDVEEEYMKKCESAVTKIEADGLYEWTNLPKELQEEAVEFIKNQSRY